MNAATPSPGNSPSTSAVADAPDAKVLVFHIGSLGDTLVALPAFWAVHDHYRQARRVLLTKSGARAGIPVGREIVAGSGLFHDVMLFDGDYHAYGSNLPRWRKLLGAAKLIWRLRRERFDVVVYLAPSERDESQVRRDLRFFGWCGIFFVIGAKAKKVYPAETDTSGAAHLREADRLLARLQGSGLELPSQAKPRIDLGLQDDDRDRVLAWSSLQESDGGRRWIGIAPGSNLSSKLWPVDRYEDVVQQLIDRFDVWPIVFGGPEDKSIGDALTGAWKRGWNTAGEFSVRTSAAALANCDLYIGNDTGTMHLAASVGVRCVAVFSARDVPGKWEPLGSGHAVIRRDVPCSGCMLVRCVEHERRCLTGISVTDVVDAAAERLKIPSPRKPFCSLSRTIKEVV